VLLSLATKCPAVAQHDVNGRQNDWGDIEELRQKLGARAGACLRRLDGAVSELFSLHSFDREEIVARVHAVIESEEDPDDQPSRAR
jgi:hypothetical protein